MTKMTYPFNEEKTFALTETLFVALLYDMPLTMTMAHIYGICTEHHYVALQRAVLHGRLSPKCLAAAAYNGPEITKIVNSLGGDHWGPIEYKTHWDVKLSTSTYAQVSNKEAS